VEALPPRRGERERLLACVVVAGLAQLGSLALQNVSAFNKTGGDAPAVLLVVPEIINTHVTVDMAIGFQHDI
jgi:hypothetical protein